jgi:2-oxoisovalerate dehydrogenase E1 component
MSVTTRPDDLDRLEVALLDGIDALVVPSGRGAPPADGQPLRAGSCLTVGLAREVFAAQLDSRHLDHAARWLRQSGHGYYTIGSAGHEGNAAVAAALRPTDPALLHYRSGGFYLARSRQAGRVDGPRDVLLGMMASSDEPIAGGRHKVFGHPDLAIIPQTSTIASHLPRAMGVAFAIGRARRLGLDLAWPPDALAVCSFGDASANHSTAQGAINAARYTAHQGIAMPVLFMCEDNGWGISVPTPPRWIETMFAAMADLRYACADGGDIAATYDTVCELAEWIRAEQRPAVLHLRTVRFLGHAGTDVETAYRAATSIRADHARDPLLGTARLLVDAGVATPGDLVADYLTSRAALRELATSLVGRPQLTSSDEVIAPLSPRRPAIVAGAAAVPAPATRRTEVFGGELPEHEGPLTLAESINRTLVDVLAARPEALVFGEDVATKGGVYGLTRGLQRRFGAARVFDTLLDEQSILGLALGTAVSGMLPIPEIQYLAYLHNAEDQLRGEAASLSFFSQGRFRNPMVVRIAGLAYQRGFGGHFHNDNAVAVLRDIPGIVVACPGHPADAPAMLRTCVAAAAVDGTVAVYLEPIALYHVRDLHAAGDGGWLAPYAPPERWGSEHVPIGVPRLARAGADVLVVTWANGLYLSLRVAERLADEGISCRVLDLRWLLPLPIEDIARHAEEIGNLVVVDETRHSAGVGEGVVTGVVARGYRGPIERIAAWDTFIPLGEAAHTVLVGEHDIEDAVRRAVAATNERGAGPVP